MVNHEFFSAEGQQKHQSGEIGKVLKKKEGKKKKTKKKKKKREILAETTRGGLNRVRF